MIDKREILPIATKIELHFGKLHSLDSLKSLYLGVNFPKLSNDKIFSKIKKENFFLMILLTL